ncbi:MAG: prealbumin-like fold domain-containing protein, partial [Erysipelotrichaceae bacterium]|nr:prealbumin-like fold domain-containing protein [Erysipelotrichaceae bacterium]
MKVRTNKIVGFVMSLILIMSSMMLSSKVEAAEKMYDVFISSLVKGTTTELVGAKFSIKDETNANVVSWDSTDAPHIAHLKSGRYTLVEDQAPNGY